MRKLIIVCIVVAVVAFWSAFNALTQDTTPISTTENQEATTVSEEVKTLATSNAEFAFDLYQTLKTEEGNLFYSPYSISTALAMTYAGAKGETEKEMAKTLHFSLAQDDLHSAFTELDGSLESRDGLELSIANALWGQQDYEFLPEFLATLEDGYGSSLQTLNFADSEASRKVINDWVAEQTKDKIKDIIPEDVLNELTRLVLANAIYFNAAWQSPFDEAQTKDEPFTLLDDSKVDVPMMSQQTRAGYMQGEGYQVLSLLYNGNMSFVAIMPDTGQFETVENQVGAEFVNELEIVGQEVILKMPKFEFEKSVELVEPMQALGMQTAFTRSDPDRCQTELLPGVADFSGMDGSYCLFISAILHKAFVKVEEKGTEAAAATAVVMETTSVSASPPPIELTLDRPFIFLIRDNVTGSILFVGRVLNPLG